MKFKAKAKSPGECAYSKCDNAANKIYTDDHWRILACSNAHADIARAQIDKIPVKHHAQVFGNVSTNK